MTDANEWRSLAFDAIQRDSVKDLRHLYKSTPSIDLNGLIFPIQIGDPNAVQVKFLTTAIHLAATLKRPKIYNWLIQHGADPNCLDSLGNTASCVTDSYSQPGPQGYQEDLARLGDQVMLYRALLQQNGANQSGLKIGEVDSRQLSTAIDPKQIKKVLKNQERRILNNEDEIDNIFSRLDTLEKTISKCLREKTDHHPVKIGSKMSDTSCGRCVIQ